MNKKYNILILSIFTMLVLVSCSSQAKRTKKYYTLEYNSRFEKEGLRQDNSFDGTILIKDADLPSTYSRKQIVVRNSPYEITYSMDHIWAVRLTDKIPELLAVRMIRYNTFHNVQRNYSTATPDYEVNIRIRNVEFIEYGEDKAAHLNMELELFDMKKNQVAFRHNVNKNQLLGTSDKEIFVQSINDIILETADEFIEKINRYENDKEVQNSNGFTDNTKNENSLSLNYDIEEVENDVFNKGQIIFPSKTASDREPFVQVFQNNNLIKEGQMGNEITLDEGEYVVRFGSGAQSQRMARTVLVNAGYKKVITPDWAWLTVNLIDENRNSVDVQYELFDLESGESYGNGRGVLEELGELLQTWVLPAGKYKITLRGEPYNAERDYITLDLTEGELEEINIIIEEETGQLLGGGSITKANLDNASKNWRYNSTLHGNANLTTDNATDKNNTELNIALNTQLDNKLVYDKHPYHVSLRLLIEGELSKLDNTDFTVTNDDITFKSTFVYYLWKNFGIYARADAKTHFYNRYAETDDPKNYLFESSAGENILHLDKEKIKLQPAFFPSEFKEGLGLNYRMLNSSKYKMNLRAGYGMTQAVNNDVYSLFASGIEHTEADTTYTVDKYTEGESVYSKGIEFSVVGQFELLKNLSFATDGDVLVPFDKTQENDYRVENQITLKLLRHISLEYNLDLAYNKNVKDYIEISNKLYLRFTYFFN